MLLHVKPYPADCSPFEDVQLLFLAVLEPRGVFHLKEECVPYIVRAGGGGGGGRERKNVSSRTRKERGR